MAGWIEEWMTSPADVPDPRDGAHPGERFGLPATGPRSVAGFGRRLAGVTIDWLLAYAGCLLFAGLAALDDPSFGWTVWLVWFAGTALFTAIPGATPGKMLLGTRVARVDMASLVGVPRALLRTLLLGLVVPALIRDGDGRSWHDRASRTVVIRTRG